MPTIKKNIVNLHIKYFPDHRPTTMTKINIIRPPKISVDSRRSFWKQMVMLVIGTTISLSFTIAAAKLTDNIQRAKDRRLSAMMVMSNIESFARTLESRAERMAQADSIATWLLGKPLDELELMPEAELDDLVSRVTVGALLARDKSAENIFSNNIETWKNVGNVQFIDNVGACFSAMEGVEEDYNNWARDMVNTYRDIKYHPNDNEGINAPMKLMRNDKMRRLMRGTHNRRCWLGYAAANLRYYNKKNMLSIGIEEQEVMAFTDKREVEVELTEKAPDAYDYYTAPIPADSLTSLAHLDQLLDSIMHHRHTK